MNSTPLGHLQRILEALIFTAEKPVTLAEMKRVLEKNPPEGLVELLEAEQQRLEALSSAPEAEEQLEDTEAQQQKEPPTPDSSPQPEQQESAQPQPSETSPPQEPNENSPKAGTATEGDSLKQPQPDPLENVLRQALQKLEDQWQVNPHAFELRNIAEGYCFMSLPAYHTWVRDAIVEREAKKLTRTVLETLAIIAYRQPVTKSEMDYIRGVDCGYAINKLMEKQLIEPAGREDGPGKPLLYRTTPDFMAYFGLSSLEDLPRPKEIETDEEKISEAYHTELAMKAADHQNPAQNATGASEQAPVGNTREEPLNPDDDETTELQNAPPAPPSEENNNND